MSRNAVRKSIKLFTTCIVITRNSAQERETDRTLSTSLCTFQAICCECLIIGAIYFNGLLAFEMGLICHDAFGPNAIVMTPKKKGDREQFRLKIYFTIYAIGVIFNIIYINVAGSITDDKFGVAGLSYCWVKTELERLFLGYILIWISMAVAIAAISYTIFTIKSVIKNLQDPSQTAGPSVLLIHI